MTDGAAKQRSDGSMLPAEPLVDADAVGADKDGAAAAATEADAL